MCVSAQHIQNILIYFYSSTAREIDQDEMTRASSEKSSSEKSAFSIELKKFFFHFARDLAAEANMCNRVRGYL